MSVGQLRRVSNGLRRREIRHICRKLSLHSMPVDHAAHALVRIRERNLSSVRRWRVDAVRCHGVAELGIVVCAAFVNDARRALVLSALVSLFHRIDPVLPAIPTTQPFNVVFRHYEVYNIRLRADHANMIHVRLHLPHAAKATDEHKWHEPLRIHVGTQVNVLAKILDGKVVLNLLTDETDDAAVIPIWLLVRDGSHGTLHLIGVVLTRLRLQMRQTGTATIRQRRPMGVVTAVSGTTSAALRSRGAPLSMTATRGRAVKTLRSLRHRTVRRVRATHHLLVPVRVSGVVTSTSSETSTTALATPFTGLLLLASISYRILA